MGVDHRVRENCNDIDKQIAALPILFHNIKRAFDQTLAIRYLEKVKDDVDDLDRANKLVLGLMVLENAVLSFLCVKVEPVIAHDETGQEEVEKEGDRDDQMKVLQLLVLRLD